MAGRGLVGRELIVGLVVMGGVQRGIGDRAATLVELEIFEGSEAGRRELMGRLCGGRGAFGSGSEVGHREKKRSWVGASSDTLRRG